jgi:cation diffusion facilitator family transporter
VAILTATMMVIEIAGGWYYNSMALLADGWHMSSHMVAMGLSLMAYVSARKYAHDPRFSFGTWKIEVLGGYTSAVFLVMMAGLMVYQSVARLIVPSAIHYDQAIAIAIVGLLVNLVSAWWLKDGHHHTHGDDTHAHAHDGHDLNLRSAYLHVLADAATSVLAIIALVCGKLWGLGWMDPLMGLVGAAMIVYWASGLLRDTGRVLLDAEMGAPVVDEIRDVIAHSPIKADIADLHVWRVGRGKYACILSLATDNDVSPEYFKKQLSVHEELVHISIEINRAK